jgi:hypothetical protein
VVTTFDLRSVTYCWRKNRQDDQVKRLLPSKIANWLIGKVTGVKLHDYGCSLKAYRAELVADMNLYGELHRFLPHWLLLKGQKSPKFPLITTLEGSDRVNMV